ARAHPGAEEGFELSGRQRGPDRRGGPAGLQAVRARGPFEGGASRRRARLPAGDARGGLQTVRQGPRREAAAVMSCGLVAAGPARGIDSIEAFRVNSATPIRCVSFSDLNGTEARMSTTTDTVIAALPVATLPHPDLDRRLEVRYRCGRISVCRAYGGSRI